MKNDLIKLRGIENTREGWQKLMDKKEVFIFTWRRVYELKYHENTGWGLEEFDLLRLGTGDGNYSRRGRWHSFTASGANDIIGREVFLEPKR